jgi:hypothetical protein
METPSASIVKAAAQTISVTDSNGRAIKLRKITPLERMRLFEIVGPENVKNEAYFGYAVLAAHVCEIDGDPVPHISSKATLEAVVQRLGDEGLQATSKGVAKNFLPPPQSDDEAIETLKNE